MSAVWFIGMDDTDVPASRGTGRLARMLAAEFAQAGLNVRGVTRHQLLVHPDVPYTTHNSTACIAVEATIPKPEPLFKGLCRYVAGRCPSGSDPGVCMARADRVSERVVEFGRRAQTEVLTLAEARRIGEEEGFLHAGLAGSEEGMIGSLAAVGLRASGEDGRFIQIGRIREVEGRAQVRTLLDAGVDAVQSARSGSPEPEDWVETLGWVRPRLTGGRPVLFVKRSSRDGVDWIVTDRRKGGKDRRD